MGKGADYVHGFMKEFQLKNELMANAMFLSESFQAIHRHLATEFGHVGTEELEAVRFAYQHYIAAQTAGLPTFDQQRYAAAAEKLMMALESLRDAFARSGRDITEIWRPFVKGVLDDMDLIDRL